MENDYFVATIQIMLAGFGVITAILIGWQIYTTISIHRLIRSQIRASLEKEMPSIKGEILGTSLYNMADQAERAGDMAYALNAYIKAASNLCATSDYAEEIGLCLDKIEQILHRLNANNQRIALPAETGVEYYNMLHEIKDDRAKSLCQRYLDLLQFRQFRD